MRRSSGSCSLSAADDRRADVAERQVERERAAHARRAAQLDLAAEQARQLAADRRPRPVPPYLRLVLASACWKASKMIRCFSGGMPMPVSVTSNATTAPAWLSTGWSGVHPPLRRLTRSAARRPASVNLKAFDSRFFSTCCRRFESVTRLRPSCGSTCTSNAELAVLRLVAGTVRATMSSRLAKKTSSASTVTVPDSIFDRSRMSRDQVQQVRAGAVDGARELDLLRREVAFGVLGELLAEDQDAVQRRAQLVRHVGQELGLVLRGERELRGLFFERAARLLDFLVLALDFGVLFGELLRLLRQLLVGLLQLLLLRLQLGGELLRLLQQAFGLHRGLDGVEHDADAGGQLLEEGEVRRP